MLLGIVSGETLVIAEKIDVFSFGVEMEGGEAVVAEMIGVKFSVLCIA